MNISSSPENVIQSACMHSLGVYFDRANVTYRQLWTYSNQQGDEVNKFCGDLVGVIDDAALLLLEMKALNHSTKGLHAFNVAQFDEAIAMENAGLPLMYCYDKDLPLAYYKSPQPKDWPSKTLDGFNVAIPSQLDSQFPKIAQHGTLLNWLNTKSAGATSSPLLKFGRIVGRVFPNDMRNGLLTLLYSPANKQAFGLSSDDLSRFYQWLIAHPGTTDQVAQERIEALRHAVVLSKNAITKSNKPKK